MTGPPAGWDADEAASRVWARATRVAELHAYIAQSGLDWAFGRADMVVQYLTRRETS